MIVRPVFRDDDGRTQLSRDECSDAQAPGREPHVGRAPGRRAASGPVLDAQTEREPAARQGTALVRDAEQVLAGLQGTASESVVRSDRSNEHTAREENR